MQHPEDLTGGGSGLRVQRRLIFLEQPQCPHLSPAERQILYLDAWRFCLLQGWRNRDPADFNGPVEKTRQKNKSFSQFSLFCLGNYSGLAFGSAWRRIEGQHPDLPLCWGSVGILEGF